MTKKEHHIISALYARVLQLRNKEITAKDRMDMECALEYILPPCERNRIRNADALARELAAQL